MQWYPVIGISLWPDAVFGGMNVAKQSYILDLTTIIGGWRVHRPPQ